MSQISVTRALAQVKSLNDRIQRGATAQFIAVSVGGKVTGKNSLAEVEAGLKSNLQSVQDLIKARGELKSAIVKSNAVTLVNIAGKEMTVAEAIERKSSITFEVQLLTQLKVQQNQAIAQVERVNLGVQQSCEKLIQTALGREIKHTDDEAKAITGPFEEKNKAALVDANKLDDLIKQMQKDIDDFLLEVDFALSEVNAKTLIDA